MSSGFVRFDDLALWPDFQMATVVMGNLCNKFELSVPFLFLSYGLVRRDGQADIRYDTIVGI